MNISRNWLQTYFDKPIPSGKELAELFPFHSFEVEGLEEVAGDAVLDVKVLPDRAHYALCHEGIALEVSVLTGQPFKLDRIPANPASTITNKPEISISDRGFCRRYSGRYVDIGPSVNGSDKTQPNTAFFCTLLGTIGQRSVNPIVDATNMVMFDIGQPLHAFDADKVKGSIVVRVAKEGETITLLDGREVKLTAADHVIADEEGPLAIAGVKGGKRAEISAETTHLIIESANFEPTAVRRTATRYDLRNDSSKRFENEITPELAERGMNDVSALIQRFYPKAVFGPAVDIYPTKATQTHISFHPAYISERLGVEVPLDKAQDILKRLGITITKKDGAKEVWDLTIPFNRLDLTISEDIVEEVGRIYGYNHVTGILPPKPAKAEPVPPIFYVSEKIKSFLVKNGFSEVSTYTFVDDGAIGIEYPLAEDKAFLRSSLIASTVSQLRYNLRNSDLLGLDIIKTFEIGNVFDFVSGQYIENMYLSLGIALAKKKVSIKLDSFVNSLISLLNSELGFAIKEESRFNEGTNLGAYQYRLGEQAKTLAGKTPQLSEMHFPPSSTNRYQKISAYPSMTRDIAIFTPASVTEADVWKVIEKGLNTSQAEKLLARHSLFDVFTKEDKVSYAFRLVFQSMERTLTDEEANNIMQTINEEIKKEKWEVR